MSGIACNQFAHCVWLGLWEKMYNRSRKLSVMKTCREYAHLADQCIEMARRVDGEMRRTLLRMAEAWLDHAFAAAGESDADEGILREVLH